MSTEDRTLKLDRLVCIKLDVHIWSGLKKLRPEDLKVQGKLPPAEVASLGSKKIISREDLRPFHALKKEAERLLESKGIRFLGGRAISAKDRAAVVGELKRIQQEFEEKRREFLDTYDDRVEHWISSHPEWEDVLRRAIAPKARVAGAISFGFDVFRIQPVVESDGQSASSGDLAQPESTLGGRLLKEVAAEANRAWDESFVGRMEITRRALRPIKSLREKLESLSFLQPGVHKVISEIDQVLGDLPKSGKISGTPLAAIRGLMALLCDSERMLAHCRGAEVVVEPLEVGQSLDEAGDDSLVEMPEPAFQAPEGVKSPVGVQPDLLEGGSDATESGDAPSVEERKVANGGWFF